MDVQEITSSLAAAGIVVINFTWNSSRIPAAAAWMISACSAEDGRLDEVFDLSDPRLIENANAAWWRLATEYRLFDERHEFLLSVGPTDGEIPASPHWARVRLHDDWDILGRGAAKGVLGGPPGHPGFVMLSLDGGVAVGGDTWDDSISIIVLPDPFNASAIRRGMGLFD
ncbi:hypothetical protein [Dactylosporangium sp. NPDC048998]|uniref:hypothetical protein n=1 Tax=Dactylosporangium sp. NPDC048998 TaxID=3363976 RepID=UPI00371D6AB6